MGQFSVEICPEVGQFLMKLNNEWIPRCVLVASHRSNRASNDLGRAL